MPKARAISRRDFIASGLIALGSVAAGPGAWRRVLAAPAIGEGPYGPLRAADANGLMLPEEFSSRIVAMSGRAVAGSSYTWHRFPDGGATFAAPNDGWLYVSNSEVSDGRGGVGAIRFDAGGKIVAAYPILSGTSRNCAGGATPWHTWLSCEEMANGRVWECDPFGERKAVVHPSMGVFNHEAAAVDPIRRHVYLTEDEPDGCFYRFTPKRYPDLNEGLLEVAQVAPDGSTSWHDVPDPSSGGRATRTQVAGSTPFDGGEGAWYHDDVVYFTTKGDDRVWAYDTSRDRMSLLYDAHSLSGAPLSGVDNVTVSKRSGDVFVAEDGGDLEIVMITPDQTVARFLRLIGTAHRGSEIAGPAMDPSGRRLYFSSQRGFGRGVTYEVTGPFRTTGGVPVGGQTTQQPLPLRERGASRLPQAGAIAGGAAVLAAGAAAWRRRTKRG